MNWSATFTGSCTGNSTAACSASCGGFGFSTASECPWIDPSYAFAITHGGTTFASASTSELQQLPDPPPPPKTPATATASALGDCTGGTVSTFTESNILFSTDYRPTAPAPNCELVFDGFSFGMGLSSASATMQCDLAGCTVLSYVPDLTVEVDLAFDNFDGHCSNPLGPGGIDSGFTGQDVTVLWTGHYSDASTQVQRVQGVFAADAPGNTPSVARLGFLAGSTYSVSGTSATARLNATNASLPFNLPMTPSAGVALVAVSSTILVDDFTTKNADFTPTNVVPDRVCWDDRRLFVAALGSAIGDGVYKAKFDYDLDGDVDNADLLAYKAIFEQSACLGDYNCTGNISIDDLNAFLADYFVQAPIADYNCSGEVSVQDLFDFLAVYYTSCT